MIQFWIALDQCLNTLVYAKGEGFGTADETLSARAWRLSHNPRWGAFRHLVDLIFFWQKDDEGKRAHCERAFVSEILRRHLPDGYKNKELISSFYL